MNRIRSCMARNSTQFERGSLPGFTLYLGGLSGSALSVPLANQPRFTKKRIAATVGVLLVTLVLLGKNLFQSLHLLFCNPSIHRSGIVADKKLLATSVTPEGSHLLETGCLFSAALLNRHSFHPSFRVYWLLTTELSDWSSQTQTLERRSSFATALVRDNL
jgi:hypothetical protein